MKRAVTPSGVELVEMPPRVEASLWRRLRFERETTCREVLFGRYRQLARSVAFRQVKIRMGRAEPGDIEQFAYQGLLEAIDRFDPLRGTPFGAFAVRRIAGCIADGASRLTEMAAGNSYRRRVEAERLRSLGDAPSKDALLALSELVSGLAIGLLLEGTGLFQDGETVDRRQGAYDSLAQREIESILRMAIDALPPREATIVRQHYEHGVSFTQIAQLLQLTKGRVSQMHKAALARLRSRLVSYD